MLDYKLLAKALGKSYRLCQEIIKHLKTEYGELIEDWKFYGQEYGWILKTLRKNAAFFSSFHLKALLFHIATSSSFSSSTAFRRRNNDMPKVSGPSLPMNIRNVITIFPRQLSWAVIPVLSPTVPRADADSNKIASKSICSVNVRR